MYIYINKYKTSYLCWEKACSYFRGILSQRSGNTSPFQALNWLTDYFHKGASERFWTQKKKKNFSTKDNRDNIKEQLVFTCNGFSILFIMFLAEKYKPHPSSLSQENQAPLASPVYFILVLTSNREFSFLIWDSEKWASSILKNYKIANIRIASGQKARYNIFCRAPHVLFPSLVKRAMHKLSFGKRMAKYW